MPPVVLGQEASHDDSTVAWLLARSLAKAREEEEVKQVEEKVAEAESCLLQELAQFRDDASRPRLYEAWAAVHWHAARIRVTKRKEKGRKKRKKRGRRWMDEAVTAQLLFMMSLYSLLTRVAPGCLRHGLLIITARFRFARGSCGKQVLQAFW